MSLQADAEDLLAVLQRVLCALRCFRHPSGATYAADMANRLQPFVADFESAVQSHSREGAAATLDGIKPLMHNISGAATKGDLAIFSDDTLDRYYELATIFQESRYGRQSL